MSCNMLSLEGRCQTPGQMETYCIGQIALIPCIGTVPKQTWQHQSPSEISFLQLLTCGHTGKNTHSKHALSLCHHHHQEPDSALPLLPEGWLTSSSSPQVGLWIAGYQLLSEETETHLLFP